MSDDPLTGFHPPTPPAGLRAQALDAARAAFAPGWTSDIWSRLLRSRAARFAWAASIVLLAAAHLALPGRPAPGSARAVQAPRLDPEVRAVAALPRISERAMAACSGDRS